MRGKILNHLMYNCNSPDKAIKIKALGIIVGLKERQTSKYIHELIRMHKSIEHRFSRNNLDHMGVFYKTKNITFDEAIKMKNASKSEEHQTLDYLMGYLDGSRTPKDPGEYIHDKEDLSQSVPFYLRHNCFGKAKVKKLGEIASFIMSDVPAYSKTPVQKLKDAIKYAIRKSKKDYPICSIRTDKGGYYWPATKEELRECIEDISAHFYTFSETVRRSIITDTKILKHYKNHSTRRKTYKFADATAPKPAVQQHFTF